MSFPAACTAIFRERISYSLPENRAETLEPTTMACPACLSLRPERAPGTVNAKERTVGCLSAICSKSLATRLASFWEGVVGPPR